MKPLKAAVPEGVKRRLKDLVGIASMESRLANLKRAGFRCAGAVDVGAWKGEWSRSLRRVWDVPLILVEPQPGCRSDLDAYRRESGGSEVHVESCALGSEEGSVEFVLEETNSRVAVAGDDSTARRIRVPVLTLERILASHPQESFNLLKVDVQGAELRVLAGAGDCLARFEVIILEVSFIRIGPVPTFIEVMDFMRDRDYRLYDILPMYYRPLDGALWQADAFFVRNDSCLVASNRWN